MLRIAGSLGSDILSYLSKRWFTINTETSGTVQIEGQYFLKQHWVFLLFAYGYGHSCLVCGSPHVAQRFCACRILG